MMLTILAFIIAFFFAMNIGGSGAAASMGIAYGAGAIPKKRIALLICGVCVFLGAVLGGGEVVKTIGSGIVPPQTFSVKVVVIVLFAATMTLFLANLLGIPLSTSEVTVGSVIGVGIAFRSLYTTKIIWIISFWIIVPFIAFFFAFIIGKGILRLEKKYAAFFQGKWEKMWMIILVGTGCFEAFSAGMNNVANSVGPLVGANLLTVAEGTLYGGLFVALGAFLFGSRVMETNGKKITDISLLQGSAISTTGGLLVVIASIFGLPVPLTQVTTSGILGIGVAKKGFSMWQKGIVHTMLKVWVVSPVLSAVIAYTLVKGLVDTDFYTVIILCGVCIATIGSISLMKTMRKERSSIYEQGGGI